MVSIRIQRPKIRIWLTALKLCDPPQTWAMASVLPWVGRMPPIGASGIQSTCVFMMPVMAPWRSGLTQTMPSDHITSSRNSATLGWSACASSGRGRPEGLKVFVSAPSRVRMPAASSLSRREKDRSRRLP